MPRHPSASVANNRTVSKSAVAEFVQRMVGGHMSSHSVVEPGTAAAGEQARSDMSVELKLPWLWPVAGQACRQHYCTTFQTRQCNLGRYCDKLGSMVEFAVGKEMWLPLTGVVNAGDIF